MKLFEQRNDVHAAFFQNRGRVERNGVEAVLLQLAGDGFGAVRKETGADAIGFGAKTQIYG